MENLTIQIDQLGSQAVEVSGVSSTLISSKYILTIATLPSNNENAKIFHIKDCKSEALFKDAFKNNFHKRYPDIFIVVVECNTDLKNEENFVKVLNSKLNSYDLVYLQLLINHEEIRMCKFYQKLNKSEDLREIILEPLNNLEEFKSFDDLRNIEDFFRIVSHLKISLVDADLTNILKFTSEEDKSFILKNRMIEKNEKLIQFLSLFLSESSEIILNFAINNKDFKILLNFLKFLQLSEIQEPLIEKVFTFCQIEVYLQEIVLKNEIRIVKMLTKFHNIFSKFIEFSMWSELRKIAQTNNLFDILFELQQLESCEKYYLELFNDNERLEKSQGNEIRIAKAITELHESIQEENLNKIEEFVKNFPDFRMCLDQKQICALEKAINLKKFEIYAYLKRENFLSDNKNHLSLKISKLSDEDKLEIRKQNTIYSKPYPEAFINKLCNKCDLHSASGYISYSAIRENIERLSKDNELRSILEFAANIKMKIIFDFTTETVRSMVPSHNEDTFGIAFHKEGNLYMGKDENIEMQFGTLIHELMHIILYFLYENKCLPYCEGDAEREKAFNQVLKEVIQEKKKFKEEIILAVFDNYKIKESRLIELPVRPAHIIARYIKEPKEKVEEISQKHPGLFRFFREIILPDLKIKKGLEIITLNNHFKVIENAKLCKFQFDPSSLLNKHYDQGHNLSTYDLNYIVDTQSRKTILSSNSPQMTIQRIIQEVYNKSEKRLDLKTKNIFVSLRNLEQESLKQRLALILYDKKEIKIERVFVLVDNFEFRNIEFFDKTKEKIHIFFICDEDFAHKLSEKIKCKIDFVIHDWSELTVDSTKAINEQDVKFQDLNEIKLSELISFDDRNKAPNMIPQDVFKILVSDKRLEINAKSIILENVIPRKFLKKGLVEEADNVFESISESLKRKNLSAKDKKFEFKEFFFENFIEELIDDKIVLISDQAGSGKTVVLHEIRKYFAKIFPNNWTSFVALKDHYDELINGKFETFEDFIIRILKFNALEALIFREKFSQGKTRILFDAFDEISPDCKEKTLNFLKLFQDQNGDKNNKIIITTRTHLEHDLETELGVFAHQLKVLETDEQITILKSIWGRSSEKQDLIDKLAVELVGKISEMVSTSTNVIGIPLIIENLGKLFKDQINEKSIEEIQTLSISGIYDKVVVKGNLEILDEKFPEKVKENAKNNESIHKVYFYFAIMQYFDEEFANELGLVHDEEEWFLEEIPRGGITNYGKNGVMRFNHETYAEFLIIKFLFSILRRFMYPSQFHIGLLQRILKEEKFQISRMFFCDMLENYNIENLKLLYSEKFKDLLTKVETSTLRYPAREGHFTICEIFFNKIKAQNIEAYKKLLETNDEKLTRTLLMEISPKIRRFDKFKAFLDQVFDDFKESIYDKFLIREDGEGNTILHLMTDDFVEVDKFEAFIDKIMTIKEREKLENLFYYKNHEDRTFLHHAIALFTKNIYKIEKILDFIRSFLTNIDERKEFLKLKNIKGRSVIHVCAFNNAAISKVIFNFFEHVFETDELREMISEVDKDGDNILHFAAQLANSKGIIEFLWAKILNIMENPNEFFMRKGKYDRNILHKTLENHSEIFEYVFNITRKIFEDQEEFKRVILEKNLENSNLLCCGASFSSKPNLKFLFNKILIIFGPDETKHLLKTTKGHDGKNLLCLAASNNKHLSSNEFLWDFFNEHLSPDEMRELINENDFQGYRFIHNFSQGCKTIDIFVFYCRKISEIVEDQKAFFLQKDICNRNMLYHTVNNRNSPDIFQYTLNLVETLYNEEFKDFILDYNPAIENVISFVVAFGSESNLKFFVEKISNIFDEAELKILLKDTRGSFNRNMLSFATSLNNDLNAIKFLWKTLEDKLSKEEISQLLYEKDNQGCNTLLVAAFTTETHNVFEFTWWKIFEIVDNPKDFFMTKHQDNRNILQFTISNQNNLNCFPFVFELLAEIFCESKELKELITEKNSDRLNLLGMAVVYAQKSNVEFLFNKLLTIFGKNETKEILKRTNGSFSRNLLNLAASSSKNLDSLKFIWAFFVNNFSKIDILLFLHERDTYDSSLFHNAAKYVKCREHFEFWWIQVKEIIDDEEDLKNFVKRKSFLGRTILLSSICEKNEQSFFFIFENILSELFMLKEFIYECDEQGENFLHYLARYGRPAIVEHSFRKLEENLEPDELKSFMKTRCGGYQLNVLHCLAYDNLNEQSVEFILSKIENYLDEDELKELLRDRSNGKFPPLHIAIGSNTSVIFSILTEFYERKFDRDEMKTILDLNRIRVVPLANSNQRDRTMVQAVQNYIENYL